MTNNQGKPPHLCSGELRGRPAGISHTSQQASATSATCQPVDFYHESQLQRVGSTEDVLWISPQLVHAFVKTFLANALQRFLLHYSSAVIL
jgi:hypothetical protein